MTETISNLRRRAQFHLKGASDEDEHDVLVLDDSEQENVLSALHNQSLTLDYRGFFIFTLLICLICFAIYPPNSGLPLLSHVPARVLIVAALFLADLSLTADYILALHEPEPIPSPLSSAPRSPPKRPPPKALSLPPEMVSTMPHLGPLIPTSCAIASLVASLAFFDWLNSQADLHEFLGWLIPSLIIGLAWLARRIVEGNQADLEGLRRLRYAYKGA